MQSTVWEPLQCTIPHELVPIFPFISYSCLLGSLPCMPCQFTIINQLCCCDKVPCSSSEFDSNPKSKFVCRKHFSIMRRLWDSCFQRVLNIRWTNTYFGGFKYGHLSSRGGGTNDWTFSISLRQTIFERTNNKIISWLTSNFLSSSSYVDMPYRKQTFRVLYFILHVVSLVYLRKNNDYYYMNHRFFFMPLIG